MSKCPVFAVPRAINQPSCVGTADERPTMRCMAVDHVLRPVARARAAGTDVPRAARYGFGDVRVATLALLIFTALSE